MGTSNVQREVCTLPHTADPHRALHSALDAHDQRRRNTFAGTLAADLAADKQIWSAIGDAFAALARRIADGCAASAFVGDQPALSALCDRLTQSVDDQLDPDAWRVVDAAARAALGR